MAYTLANIFIILITTHFTYHVLTVIFSKRQRKGMQQANTRLDVLRCKPIKTVVEQKEFINIKRPKRIGTFKWRWLSIPKFLLTMIIYITLFRLYFYVFDYFGLNFVLWQAILYVIIFPLILNLILEKFKVQKGDISVFFRKSRGGIKNDSCNNDRKKNSKEVVSKNDE